MGSILSGVIAAITPTNSDRAVLTDVNAFLSRLRAELKSRRINATPVLGGSFAKDTWLKGDYDVDVFVAFDPKHKADDLSGLLESALKKWKPSRIHGSRDYFQIKGAVNYEIIPVLKLTNARNAENVTDFSPKHVTWVNSKGKRFKNDIRLLKKFCKAQRLYGAESYIRGFSGHVVDILVIHYKGFLPLLKAATKWTDKTIIDPENKYKGQALLHINTSKTQGPLVVVDPVQPDRNAAAAVAKEHFDAFIAQAKRFLKKPSASFFIEQHADAKALKQKGAHIIKLVTLNEKEDVAGTKMVKAFTFLKDKLANAGFTVTAGWEWDRKKHAWFWFMTKEKQLPLTLIKNGPPKAMAKDAIAFKKKYKNAKISKGRWQASVKRELRTPDAVLKRALKDDYLKDKARW